VKGSKRNVPTRSPLRPSKVRVDGDDDLLLVRLLMGAQPTLLIVAAAEVGIFDCIGQQMLGADEIATAAELDARATRLVLDGLVGLGVLTKQRGCYRNTPTSLRHLCIEGPHSDAVRLWISGTRQWERLPQILKTGRIPEPALETRAWQREERENRAFVRSMYDLGWLAAQRVAETVDLQGVSHLVDLGGGAGHYAIAMLQSAPELRATVVDLPLTILVTDEKIRQLGLSDRVGVKACDLYDMDSPIPVLPGSADLVLMSHLVHMEGPEQNAELVSRASELLVPGGRLIVHDLFLEEDRTTPQQSSMFAVHMLAMTGRGEVYTPSEICAWLEDAGLDVRVFSTSPFLVEGSRPEKTTET